jgi:hypothetical protein
MHLDSIIPVLSAAILRSAWVESDATVQAGMWEPLLLFLKGGYSSDVRAYGLLKLFLQSFRMLGSLSWFMITMWMKQEQMSRMRMRVTQKIL